MDEFALSGLTPLASDLVKPPRVAESKAQMECRLRQIVRISDKPGGGNLVLGDVLRFHVLESLLDGYQDRSGQAECHRPHGRANLRPHPRPIQYGAAEITAAATFVSGA